MTAEATILPAGTPVEAEEDPGSAGGGGSSSSFSGCS